MKELVFLGSHLIPTALIQTASSRLLNLDLYMVFFYYVVPFYLFICLIGLRAVII